jgi:DNA-binding IclR family transcriptional regulator
MVCLGMNNTTERNEVSLHEVKIYLALRSKPDTWLTNREISESAGVVERTTRMHTLRLVKLGMLEQAEVFPAHRFRWSTKAARRNVAYAQRLEVASEIFGLMV